MNISKVFRLCAAALAAGAFSLIVGCETESAADATITVTPVHAELTAANPSITLKASGGWDYIWNLNNSAAGYLIKATGASDTYTAVQFGGTNAVEQVVTVSGMGGATNAASASARITLSQK
jgi:VCBS repeat-containing protein